MRDVFRNWLVCVLGCGLLVACEDTSIVPPVTSPTATAQNPSKGEPTKPKPTPQVAEDASVDEEDAQVDEKGDDEAPPPPPKPSKDKGDKGDKGDKPGDTKPEPKPDAGPPPETKPDLPPVAGTAESSSCYSYTKANGTMCASYYCGVTVEQLKAESSTSGACKDVEYACNGDLSNVTTACARRINATMFGASDSALRAATAACVFENADAREHVEPECLDCFLDSLECISTACLIQCLQGDSPQCERCAREAGCLDDVWACTGQPDPF